MNFRSLIGHIYIDETILNTSAIPDPYDIIYNTTCKEIKENEDNDN